LPEPKTTSHSVGQGVRAAGKDDPAQAASQKPTLPKDAAAQRKSLVVPLALAGAVVIGAGAWFALRTPPSQEAPASTVMPVPVEPTKPSPEPVVAVSSPVPPAQVTSAASSVPTASPTQVPQTPAANVPSKKIGADVQPAKEKPAARTGPAIQKPQPAQVAPVSTDEVPKPVPPSPPAIESTPTPTPPTQVLPAEAAWYTALKRELGVCNQDSNFFTRALCVEKVKWRHCDSGKHWGEVKECVQTKRSEINN